MDSPTENKQSGRAYRKLFLAALTMCAVAAVWYIATDGFADPTESIANADSGEAKAVEAETENPTGTKFALSGDNTDIKWTGSNSLGQTPTGFFYELTGNASLAPNNSDLARLEILIDMHGVKAMAGALTKKLKHKGFFEVEKFPTAKFVSTSISKDVDPDHPAGTNLVVEGNFQLRDVTRSIKIPMECSCENGSLKLNSKFKINRKDYGVVYSDEIGDRLIRDSVMIELSIDSRRKTEPSIPSEATTVATKESDTVKATANRSNFTETIKTTLVEFDMVFVSGDSEKGIKPFCIGKTEVTWNEFDYWALCKNMQEKDKIDEISQLLRPSSPHDLEKIYRGWGRDNQPVVGISKLSAELYCKWLSEETGKEISLANVSRMGPRF